MMRILAIGLAVALATVLVPQGSVTAEPASAKAQKGKVQPSGSGLNPDQATTMTAIALAESAKKKGLKAKLPKKNEDSRGLWQINRDRKSRRGTHGGLGESGQMESLRLQQNADRYQKAVTIRSNAAKKQSETKKGVVRKLQ